MSIRWTLAATLFTLPQVSEFSGTPHLGLRAASVKTAAHSVATPPQRSEWNDPKDIARVTKAFDTWLSAVLLKDRATAARFHDDGFRAGTGDKLLDKNQHLTVQMTVGNREMKLISIQTRRVGDLLFAWSAHFIRADPVPEIPAIGLTGDWGGREIAKRGFVQGEFSVWRSEDGQLKCLAFTSNRKAPTPDGGRVPGTGTK